MGYQFKEPNNINPDGFWEDIDFHGANWDFLNGKITYPAWIEQVFAVIAERKQKGIPWGFKDPDASHFLGLYLSFFKEPRIIRCTRDKRLVVNSLMTKLGHTKERAENVWEMKEMILDNLLSRRNHLVIHFGEGHLKDEEIIKEIRGKWNDGIYHRLEEQARN